MDHPRLVIVIILAIALGVALTLMMQSLLQDYHNHKLKNAK